MEIEREIPVDQLDKLIRCRRQDAHHLLLLALENLSDANTVTERVLSACPAYADARDAIIDCLQFVREEEL